VHEFLHIIGLFCRIKSLLQGYCTKKTYHFIDPTNRSHPIVHIQMTHTNTISHGWSIPTEDHLDLCVQRTCCAKEPTLWIKGCVCDAAWGKAYHIQFLHCIYCTFSMNYPIVATDFGFTFLSRAQTHSSEQLCATLHSHGRQSQCSKADVPNTLQHTATESQRRRLI